MEEIMQTVEIATENHAPDDGEQRISAAELLGLAPHQEAPAEAPEITVGEQKADDAPQRANKQEDTVNAFARMRRSMERQHEQKLAADPLRILGQKIVGDIMRAQPDISEADAITAAENNLMQAIAERENITPNIARAIYGQAIQASIGPQEAGPDVSAKAAQVAEELTIMELPNGFSLEAAKDDPAFVQLLWDMPAPAAVRVYHAEQAAKTAQIKATQDVAEKLQARQQVPQPLARELPVTPEINYSALSDEEVLAARRQRQEARRGY